MRTFLMSLREDIIKESRQERIRTIDIIETAVVLFPLVSSKRRLVAQAKLEHRRTCDSGWSEESLVRQ